MNQPQKIYSAFHFPNGMVAVFDDRGEQMPQLQGRYEDVVHKIAPLTDDDTQLFGSWPVNVRGRQKP